MNLKARRQSRKKALAAHVPHKCVICGYAKHIEVCHIKPVHTFHDNTPPAIINADSNVTFLCPTHHWEFDHGMLRKTPPSLEELIRTTHKKANTAVPDKGKSAGHTV